MKAHFGRGHDRRTTGLARHLAHHISRRTAERRILSVDWIPLFRGIETAALHRILSECDVMQLAPGATLLSAGEANHSVFILLSGKLAAQLDSSHAVEAAAVIEPGECIGELSAIDGKRTSAWVFALSDARVLRLARDVFWDQVMTIPGVAGRLMVILAERMRRSGEQMLKAQRETLELAHLRKEFEVARQLQMSMLPLQRPLFPENSDISVCGFMEPAAKVGGDLFDAFFVDEQRLFICIGDVSGHGVVAALFMARTIGLLRVIAMNEPQPDEILRILNERLCQGNETNIFVTLFCAFIDLPTRRIIYSNAGHCAPLLLHGGTVSALNIPKGALVGAFPGMNYSTMEYIADRGDLLFCYTDGVTEAQNREHEEYAEHRCISVLTDVSDVSLQSLLDHIRQELALFTETSLLEDDCTMLAVRFS